MDILKFRGIILFIVAFLNIVLAFIVWYKNRKNKTNFWLGFSAVFSAVFTFFCGATYFFWQANSIVSIYWYRTTWLGVLMLPPFVIFTYYFTQKLNKLKLKSILLYLLALAISFLALTTSLFAKSVYFEYPNITSSPGVLDLFGRLYILFCTVLVLFNLGKYFFKSSGIRKLQIKYFVLGTAIFAIGGIIATGIIPLLKKESPYYDVPAYLSFLWMGLTSYAMLRYRLMDIRVVVGKTAVYLLSFLATIGASFVLMFFNVFLPIIIIIAVLFYQFFFKIFEKIASRYFYYSFYSSQKVLTELGKKLVMILDISELSNTIAQTLIFTMKLDRAVVLFREKTGRFIILKNIGFKEENGISMVKDSFLTEFLEKTQKPLVFEELSLAEKDANTEQERISLRKLQDNMKHIEAIVCLPLLRGKNITGIIILGKKLSGDSYSKEDISLLSILTNQASVALQNAFLYDQVSDLSQNLQEKVDEQTKELKKALTELQEVDKAKSEFISMASHQLRTPLTAIRGYLSMLKEGDFGKPTDLMAMPLNNILLSIERLIKLVNDLLSISKIELGNIKIDKKPVKIEEVLQSCFDELKIKAKEKKLKFIFQKPKEKLPEIMANELALRQIILNLLDNAIHYTIKGEVILSAEIKNSNNILIKVEDTGQGIDKQEMVNLFKSFVRGSAGTNLFIEGTGLGLSVAKKYIDLHQGKIWAESPGIGHGSAFFAELPVN